MRAYLRTGVLAKIPPVMGLVVAATVGLVAWVALWAIGAKSFDAFLVTGAVLVLAVTARILLRFLPGQRD